MIKELYKHGLMDQLAEPYLALSPQGTLYLQPHIGFALKILDDSSHAIKNTPLPKPRLFKDYVDFEPFIKKYGSNRSAVLKWKTKWTEPCGIAIVQNRYMVLCYKELKDDLISIKYFIHIYDLIEKASVVSWKASPGRLAFGGSLAYFVVEPATESVQEYNLLLSGYSIESLIH